MELHQLDYVIAVAKYHNFTHAAEEIFVSQSSLSIQISKLELELGVRLFERNPKSVTLTPAGRKFLIYAQNICNEMKSAKEAMNDFISADHGNILIGSFPSASHFGLTSYVASFKKEYPKIQLDIHEAECHELLEMLKTFEIDVAFLTEYNTMDNIKFYPLIHDELVLVTSNSHPLADRKVIELQEIAKENFIFMESTTAYKDALEICRKAGFEPNITFLSTNIKRIDTILQLVSEGMGITLISSRVADLHKNLGISVIRFNPKKPRIATLAIQNRIENRPIIKSFLNYVIKKTQKNTE